ncbi:MAG: SPOR domain-containing protein [Bacteroides sp.]|nr:SPOR domain-containing protein [Bacteroides sp.]
MTIGESIKQLLEERKRVILPGFGNLEIKESDGVISSSAKRIDPPGLFIRFDGSFSKDDGVLAAAYSAKGGVDKEEAEQQVLELVDAIRFALDKGETYPLADAGIFNRDDDGKVHFEANPSWVLEEDQYGLGSMDLFELEDLPEEEEVSTGLSSETPEVEAEEEAVPGTGPMLELDEDEEIEEKVQEKAAEKTPSKPVAKLVTKQSPQPPWKPASRQSDPYKNEETRRRAKLWKSIWIITGILVVVLVVLLLIPSDKGAQKRGKNHPQMPVQTEKAVEKPEVQDPAATEQLDPVLTEPEPEPPQALEQPNHFFIVAGSFRNLVNASELQDKLVAKGYPAEVMITENRMYRVSIGSYPTSAEAERKLNSIKSEPGMESCWLLSNE